VLPSFQLVLWTMDFPERLVRIRKERGLTQQQLADLAKVHVVQIRRYEGGVSQPAADILKRLAIALSVSADMLLFDETERGPDDDLRLQFEALAAISTEEKQVVKSMLEAIILKHRVSGAVKELSSEQIPKAAAKKKVAAKKKKPDPEKAKT
jgi:transcriptional regulator with XRE-family HTH domain